MDLETRKIIHVLSIMITSPCNVYPLTPHFYIQYVVKLGFTGVYVFLLVLL